MHIKKLKATFGTLKDAELTLSPGLNIICAPNEGGKSSWSAFLLAMLFGIDSGRRVRRGELPDKSLYAPWSGGAMEGSMDVFFGGRELTLSRTGTQKAPMSELKAVYSGTDEPVRELSGNDAGEALTGVSKGVYQRSAFIRQQSLGVSGSPDLERRIASIVSTGEELDSYTEADERLRKWQRRRRYNKSGEIPRLESEIAALREKLRDTDSQNRQRAGLEDELKSLTSKRVQLTNEMTRERKRTRSEALDKMSKSQRELRARQSELDASRQELGKRTDELGQSIFGVTAPEELEERVMQDAGHAAGLSEAGKKLPSPALAIILSLLCLAGVVAGIIYEPLIFMAAAVFLGLSVWAIISSSKRKKAVLAARAELSELLGRYDTPDPGGIEDLLLIHREKWKIYTAARNKKNEAEARLQAANEKQKDIDAKLLQDLDFSAGETRAARMGQELKSLEERISIIREDLAALEGRESVTGDPLLIKAQLDGLEAELREQNRQYEALDLAIDVMARANTEISAKFTPGLGERATELMSRITGEKYDQLSFSRDFEKASARRSGDIISRDSAYLSTGTLDQLYLALRLAICELALPSDETCPVILDDALINFDDDRMEKALDLLVELSRDRQIILFTCHSREARYLDGRKGVSVIMGGPLPLEISGH